MAMAAEAQEAAEQELQRQRDQEAAALLQAAEIRGAQDSPAQVLARCLPPTANLASFTSAALSICQTQVVRVSPRPDAPVTSFLTVQVTILALQPKHIELEHAPTLSCAACSRQHHVSPPRSRNSCSRTSADHRGCRMATTQCGRVPLCRLSTAAPAHTPTCRSRSGRGLLHRRPSMAG